MREPCNHISGSHWFPRSCGYVRPCPLHDRPQEKRLSWEEFNGFVDSWVSWADRDGASPPQAEPVPPLEHDPSVPALSPPMPRLFSEDE